VRNPHLFCFVEECRWPCARGRSGLIITGHRSISVFKVDTAVLVNLRSNPICFFRPIHKRARIRDRIYDARHLLGKVFPGRNTRNHGVWQLSADPPPCPIFSCKSEKKTSPSNTFTHYVRRASRGTCTGLTISSVSLLWNIDPNGHIMSTCSMFGPR